MAPVLPLSQEVVKVPVQNPYHIKVVESDASGVFRTHSIVGTHSEFGRPFQDEHFPDEYTTTPWNKKRKVARIFSLLSVFLFMISVIVLIVYASTSAPPSGGSEGVDEGRQQQQQPSPVIAPSSAPTCTFDNSVCGWQSAENGFRRRKPSDIANWHKPRIGHVMYADVGDVRSGVIVLSHATTWPVGCLAFSYKVRAVSGIANMKVRIIAGDSNVRVIVTNPKYINLTSNGESSLKTRWLRVRTSPVSIAKHGKIGKGEPRIQIVVSMNKWKGGVAIDDVTTCRGRGAGRTISVDIMVVVLFVVVLLLDAYE